ncbi:DUF3800 domain-containing protein [Leifsonia sp. NPDC102414]|uniref:DUF3800 domain-containing protein n=1 Tax=Leifsonia sp. NPDC102414 TaxID=3364124 RepID=UPI00381B5CA0
MLQAYIDESGVAGEAARSSKHFVLGAFIIDEEQSAQRAVDFLAELREGTHRQEGKHLHWNQVNQHGARKYLTQSLGDQDWIKLSAVVVCREHITDSLPNAQVRYQFTLRLLLERLSWFAASKGKKLHYTVSHYKGMQKDYFREYEDRLRRAPGEIKMQWLDRAGGSVANNEDIQLLQFGDIVASSTATAFEPDKWGYVERDYLRRTAPRFYRYEDKKLLRYGLKLQPNSAESMPHYSWLGDLT